MGKYLELFLGEVGDLTEKTKLENKPYVAYSTKEGRVVYTVVPKKEENNITFDIYAGVPSTLDPTLTYNAVDLGLPSGTLWADRNIGAKSIDDRGVYFQWGDPAYYKWQVIKSYTLDEFRMMVQNISGENLSDEELINIINTGDSYNLLLGASIDLGITIWDLYNSLGIDLTTVTSFPFNDADVDTSALDKLSQENSLLYVWNVSYKDYKYGDGNTTNMPNVTYTKYNEQDNKTILDLEDDAAYVYLGSDWRTPNYKQLTELIENTTQYVVFNDGSECPYSEFVYDLDWSNVVYIKLQSKTNNEFLLFGRNGYEDGFYLWASEREADSEPYQLYSAENNGLTISKVGVNTHFLIQLLGSRIATKNIRACIPGE